MRGIALGVSAALLALLSFATAAQAAVPTVSNLAATDIQGVSALLKGEVNTEGLATTYRFEYVDQGAFAKGGFAAAIKTPVASAGSGSAPHPPPASVPGL